MLESGLSGSVRGVPSNGNPYRDPGSISAIWSACLHVGNPLGSGKRTNHGSVEVRWPDSVPISPKWRSPSHQCRWRQIFGIGRAIASLLGAEQRASPHWPALLG